MGTFTPITMRCTQEQFDAVKPKLKDLKIFMFNKEWNSFYLALFKDGSITNGLIHSGDREIHEEWNEEIFLKACGIEVETLQEKAIRLENELEEVRHLIREENKPKIGDWVVNTHHGSVFKNDTINLGINHPNRYKKITNPELIELLEQEIK